ncbi:beta-ketoacyl-ACP synthase II [Cucumibacter marinus]|uniref:beta-ketoacyl-ACP synthase II n=1 Tax=Cucumibacter marinus TaxID=1121252 RepID=UPI000412357B|nr:beta-ketoacyl-ACP synthase II [Cucumibacter marinus]
MKTDPNDPIVVTGMGVVSPLGVGVDAVWQRLIDGGSGIVPNDRFDTTGFRSGIAGLVPGLYRDPEAGFDPSSVLDPKDLKKADVFIHYALGAAAQALEQAGWSPTTDEEKEATATVIGSGVGGSPVMARTVEIILNQGPRRLSPFTVPSFLANLAAGWVSIVHELKGPIGAPVTACAASAQAIGDGMRLILSGEAEIAVVGGAEGSVDPISIGGFGAARTLSSRPAEEAALASRPFDKGRDGFVLSEGGAALVIERLSHAQARGAIPLAEIAGYGTSADAYHLTAGRPDGEGAQRAMRSAIRMAGLNSSDIGYVNAHATSTEVGDAIELAALGSLFADSAEMPALSSTKASTGHMLGAAGAMEALISVQALRTGILPPTINLDNPDDEATRFDLIRGKGVEKSVRYALSNSFGFGGVNAALVFGAINA